MMLLGNLWTEFQLDQGPQPKRPDHGAGGSGHDWCGLCVGPPITEASLDAACTLVGIFYYGSGGEGHRE